MNGRIPERNEADLLRTLRSVRKINPDDSATNRALQRAVGTIQNDMLKKSTSSSWKGVFMRSGIAASILIVTAAVVWFAASGPEAVANPTWNDIAQQFIGFDSVHISLIGHEDKELNGRGDIWIKSPGRFRSEFYEPVDGKIVKTQCAIGSSDKTVRWDERSKIGEYGSTDDPEKGVPVLIRTVEAFLSLRLLADTPEADATINGELVTFEPLNRPHPEDTTLRGFKLVPRDESSSKSLEFLPSLEYWFLGSSNTLSRLVIKSKNNDGKQGMELVLDFTPEIPDGWFEVRLPDYCTDYGAGLVGRLPEDVREVYDEVVAARKRFGNYRAVIWRDGVAGWPTNREAALGEKWRCDEIDWTVMHSAVYSGNNPRGFTKIGPRADFELLWEQVTRDDYELSRSAMTWEDKFALVYYKLSGRGPRSSGQLWERIGAGAFEWRDLSRAIWFVAWPEWVSWENLHHHGWEFNEPLLQWRLEPTDSKGAGLVEVVAERKEGELRYLKYTFDPQKDWLCVRQEYRDAWGDDADVVTIDEFAQTSDGFWYPRRVTCNVSGGQSSFEYAVSRSDVDDEFFVWPDSVPQPVDEFAEMEARALASDDGNVDLPDTAKGKYVQRPARGLPRGFSDKEKSTAHWEMFHNMVAIVATLNDYAYKHDWEFPGNLQVLVDEGYLEAERLTNPLHPEADPPFGYIRPQFHLPNRSERMVLFEPFDEWPGVVSVMFGDHTMENIHEEAEFKRLMREATSPEPPSRPYDSAKEVNK